MRPLLARITHANRLFASGAQIRSEQVRRRIGGLVSRAVCDAIVVACNSSATTWRGSPSDVPSRGGTTDETRGESFGLLSMSMVRTSQHELATVRSVRSLLSAVRWFGQQH